MGRMGRIMSVKPIKTKTHLVKILLTTLAVAIMQLGFLLSAKSLPFFPTVDLHVLAGTSELQVSVIQGMIPMSNAAAFLAFILIYLHFEFYGFKSGFYSAINTAFCLAATFGILRLLNMYTMDATNSHTDALITELFAFPTRSVLAFDLAVLAGFSTALILAGLIKTLTRNYLMILRFPIGALVGFGVFTAIKIYLAKFDELAPISMLYEAASPFSQFFALILASVIPLYFIRFFLGLFRGRFIEEEKETAKKSGSMFKTESPSEIASAPVIVAQQAPPPIQEPVRPILTAVPPPMAVGESAPVITNIPENMIGIPLVPDEAANNIEHTVSKKIRFDDVSLTKS